MDFIVTAFTQTGQNSQKWGNFLTPKSPSIQAKFWHPKIKSEKNFPTKSTIS